MALRQRRILLTEDKDFGELVMRAGAAAPGVVLFRDLGAAIDEIWGSLRALLERRGGGIERYLVVINGRRARLRPLAP
jgi:predicted nuclease of predicted toxin-antitoxin system